MISKFKQRLASDEGFTLIELLVVIVILGILLAIAVPSYLGFKARAEKSAARANVRAAMPAVEAYYADNNTYAGMTAAASAGELRRRHQGHARRHPDGVGVLHQVDGGHLDRPRHRPGRHDHARRQLRVAAFQSGSNDEGREQSRPSSFWPQQFGLKVPEPAVDSTAHGHPRVTSVPPARGQRPARRHLRLHRTATAHSRRRTQLRLALDRRTRPPLAALLPGRVHLRIARPLDRRRQAGCRFAAAPRTSRPSSSRFSRRRSGSPGTPRPPTA